MRILSRRSGQKNVHSPAKKRDDLGSSCDLQNSKNMCQNSRRCSRIWKKPVMYRSMAMLRKTQNRFLSNFCKRILRFDIIDHQNRFIGSKVITARVNAPRQSILG